MVLLANKQWRYLFQHVQAWEKNPDFSAVLKERWHVYAYQLKWTGPSTNIWNDHDASNAMP